MQHLHPPQVNVSQSPTYSLSYLLLVRIEILLASLLFRVCTAHVQLLLSAFSCGHGGLLLHGSAILADPRRHLVDGCV